MMKDKKVVHLCKNCIEMLKECNPYIVPIKIIETDYEHCDNRTEKGKFINLPLEEQ